MDMYISINGRQTGPFEEEAVLAQLASGNLSPDDMAIRLGDTGWTRLGDMFAEYRSVRPGMAPSPVVQFPPQQNLPRYYGMNQAPDYRGFFQRLAIIIGARVIVILLISLIMFILCIVVLILFWFLQLVAI